MRTDYDEIKKSRLNENKVLIAQKDDLTTKLVNDSLPFHVEIGFKLDITDIKEDDNDDSLPYYVHDGFKLDCRDDSYYCVQQSCLSDRPRVCQS